jgi:hypothetical protein
VLQTEPSPLSHVEGKSPMLDIIEVLVLLSCLKETLTDVQQELVSVKNLSFHRLITNLARSIVTKRRGITAINNPKRGVLQC